MKFVAIFLCAALCCTLAACGGPPASSAAPGFVSMPLAPAQLPGSAADYRQVIEGARAGGDYSNRLYDIVTGPEDDRYDIVFAESYGLVPGDMQRYAVSNPASLTLAYCVAVILPEPGKQQAVLQQVNAFVEMRKKAMENYLQPQFEIADNAIVKVAPTGEVLLAMCENPGEVMAAMEAALAADTQKNVDSPNSAR